MIGIVDYGVGNLFSLSRSLRYLGLESNLVDREEALLRADRLILPGVGAFGDAAEKLREKGLDGALVRYAASGRPLMGICLGMQLLFERSCEFGEHEGLSLLYGQIEKMDTNLKLPQIGWNALKLLRPSPLTKYLRDGDFVYYVHSYAAQNVGEQLIAASDYGCEVAGIAQKGNVFGCQFHPEKSGKVGLSILKAFSEVPPC